MASPRKNRGEYRPIYETLFHGKDYRRLSPEGKLTLLTLKGLCGAIGLKPWPALAETLSELTGIALAKQKKAIADLKAAEWIQYEDGMVWVVRGLEFEPHYSPDNHNHHKSLAGILDTLPRGPIVHRFRVRYAAFLGVPSQGNTHGNMQGMGDAIPPAIGEPTTTTTPSPSTSPSPSPTTNHSESEHGIQARGRWLVVAANKGIAERWGEQPNPIRATAANSYKAINEISAAGVDFDFATGVIYEYTKTLNTSDGRPPQTLKYFTQFVVNRWHAHLAKLDADSFMPNTSVAPELDGFHADAIVFARQGLEDFQHYCDEHNLPWRRAS